MTYRVLVTGCRDWRDEAAVERVLDALLLKHGQLTLVNGACRTGADDIARIWATALDKRGIVQTEPHPADWARGHSAGPERNEEMARAGADLCVAFWDGASNGTLDMIRRAVKHGIPVRIVGKAARA